jgi:hypothetical protein
MGIYILSLGIGTATQRRVCVVQEKVQGCNDPKAENLGEKTEEDRTVDH